MALTTFTAGTKAKASEVNDNFSELKNRYVKATLNDNAEETHTGDTNWTTLKTGTITPNDSDNVILGLSYSADLKTSNGGTTANLRIRIGGAVVLSQTTNNTTYETKAGITNDVGNMNQSSYAVDIQVKIDNGSDTVSIRNVTITVVYLDSRGILQTETPSFS